MPTTSWSVARNEIAQELGYFSFTSDNITTTTVVSAALGNYFTSNDFFIGWYVLIEAGTNAGQYRRVVSPYTASTGTLTVTGAALTADSTARACSLHRFDPVVLRNHFNRSRQDLFPQVAIVRNYRTMATGQKQRIYTLPSTFRGGPRLVFLGRFLSAANIAENVLSNPDFETWTNSTTPGSWTIAGGTATVNQEKQTSNNRNYAVLRGSNSARIAVPASTAVTLLQTVDLTTATSVAVEGMQMNLGIWVYCQIASRVSARISGTDITSSPVLSTAHSGLGWEQLTVVADRSGAAASTFTVGIDVTSAAALVQCYVDEAILLVGQSEALEPDWEPVSSWRWIPPVGGGANGGLLEFPYILPEQRTIRIVGRDLLSSVTADADTFEIDGELLPLLYNDVRRKACLEAALNGPIKDREFWQEKAREFEGRVKMAVESGVGIRWPNPRVLLPDGR